jgi:hypothetical protein
MLVTGTCARCGAVKTFPEENPPVCECLDPTSPAYIPPGEAEEVGYRCIECGGSLWNQHSWCGRCFPHRIVGETWQIEVEKEDTND